jgi:hypothetical protein
VTGPGKAYADIDLGAFASWRHSSRAFLNIYAVHRELDPHTYTVAPQQSLEVVLADDGDWRTGTCPGHNHES